MVDEGQPLVLEMLSQIYPVRAKTPIFNPGP